MTVSCYPQDGKRKSYDICSAFAQGCGGQLVVDGKYRGGPAMFYGIHESNEQVWRDVRASGEDWIYTDNAYFDPVRGTYFRVAKNRLQHAGVGSSDGKRFAALGIEIKPWRASGSFVLVCPQSDAFMRVAVFYDGSWTNDSMAALKAVTDREIRARSWERDKKKAYEELPAALAGAHALVTYSSAAAITAVLAGVPIVATAEDCAMRPMSGTIAGIEDLPMPDNRREWASVIADAQFTLDEFRSGMAWEAIR